MKARHRASSLGLSRKSIRATRNKGRQGARNVSFLKNLHRPLHYRRARPKASAWIRRASRHAQLLAIGLENRAIRLGRVAQSSARLAMDARVPGAITRCSLGIGQLLLALHGTTRAFDGRLIAGTRAARHPGIIAIHNGNAGFPFHAGHVFGQAFILWRPGFRRAFITRCISRGSPACAASASAPAHSPASRGIDAAALATNATRSS